jgi:hypothetical protein
MSKLLKRAGFMIALGGVGVVAPGDALADHFYRFGGSICRPVSGSDSGYLDYSNGGIANNSGATRDIACGISLPNDSGTAPIIKAVRVVVYDRNSAGRVTCSMWGIGALDFSTYWSPASAVQTTDADQATTPFTKAFSLPGTQAALQIYLTCSIPVVTFPPPPPNVGIAGKSGLAAIEVQTN